MAVKRFTQITCDVTGTVSELMECGATEAKQILRAQGWRFRGGVHRCPAAVATQTEEAVFEGEEVES